MNRKKSFFIILTIILLYPFLLRVILGTASIFEALIVTMLSFLLMFPTLPLVLFSFYPWAFIAFGLVFLVPPLVIWQAAKRGRTNEGLWVCFALILLSYTISFAQYELFCQSSPNLCGEFGASIVGMFTAIALLGVLVTLTSLGIFAQGAPKSLQNLEQAVTANSDR